MHYGGSSAIWPRTGNARGGKPLQFGFCWVANAQRKLIRGKARKQARPHYVGDEAAY